jgi:chromosome segregation ATPase
MYDGSSSSALISQNSESESAQSVHHICFRVSREVKEVWDSLSRSDKLVLTRFFRDAVASFSSTRSIFTLGVKDFAEAISFLKVAYDGCREALRGCEERLSEVDGVASRYRERVEELEKRVEELQSLVRKKDEEISRLLSRLRQVEDLTKLELLVCSLLGKDKLLAEELKKTGLIKLCE